MSARNSSLFIFFRVLVVAFFCTLSIHAEVKQNRVDKILENSMGQSLEKLLSLTNYLERHNYIYRHDAKEIVSVFNTSDKVDVERLNDLGLMIDSFKKEVLGNPRVRIDVKERVETQVNEILGLIQISFSKRNSILNTSKMNSDIKIYKDRINTLERVEKPVPSKIITKTNKFNTVVPFAIGSLLFLSSVIYFYDRKKKLRKIKKMKNYLTAYSKKIKKIEGDNSFGAKVVSVVNELDNPVCLATSLDGKVVGFSKSFKIMFSNYINLETENWDEFFDNNFYKNNGVDNQYHIYKFRKNNFLNFEISSQLIKEESLRFLTFRVIDSEKLISLRESELSKLEYGVSSANEALERALSRVSKTQGISNIVVDNSSLDSDIPTYSSSESLEEMFYRLLFFTQIFNREMNNTNNINIKLERYEKVLKLSANVEDTNFTLDSSSKVNDSIRSLSALVAEEDGEFRVYQESLSGKLSVVFELNVFDYDVAFTNRAVTMVANENNI